MKRGIPGVRKLSPSLGAASVHSWQVLATLSKEDLRRQAEPCTQRLPCGGMARAGFVEAKDEEVANVIFAELARLKKAHANIPPTSQGTKVRNLRRSVQCRAKPQKHA